MIVAFKGKKMIENFCAKYDHDLTSDPEKVSRSCLSDQCSYDPNSLAPVRILLNI